jgi:hypothetical protein
MERGSSNLSHGSGYLLYRVARRGGGVGGFARARAINLVCQIPLPSKAESKSGLVAGA